MRGLWGYRHRNGYGSPVRRGVRLGRRFFGRKGVRYGKDSPSAQCRQVLTQQREVPIWLQGIDASGSARCLIQAAYPIANELGRDRISARKDAQGVQPRGRGIVPEKTGAGSLPQGSPGSAPSHSPAHDPAPPAEMWCADTNSETAGSYWPSESTSTIVRYAAALTDMESCRLFCGERGSFGPRMCSATGLVVATQDDIPGARRCSARHAGPHNQARGRIVQRQQVGGGRCAGNHPRSVRSPTGPCEYRKWPKTWP